jgi:hypothetical protein
MGEENEGFDYCFGIIDRFICTEYAPKHGRRHAVKRGGVL